MIPEALFNHFSHRFNKRNALRTLQVPFMKLQTFSEVPPSLKPGEQAVCVSLPRSIEAQHLVQVQCLRPFLQPARYAVEFLVFSGFDNLLTTL